ncbi:hypothetical protein LIPSTDRAFT_101907 [Lipomyces starkeyi NRRL Y-11557]|uniref:Uncharacterized protein n=1 Tax=Lipomyces starkeyi NRRL Y-11557 TaxID=675824 RepID=A0A1E3QHT1_LIPST|nr:hypothetical protein LIPSTDRAFT_101907 [Lipomyces starkeyi NRRL Y-11557]
MAFSRHRDASRSRRRTSSAGHRVRYIWTGAVYLATLDLVDIFNSSAGVLNSSK